jgi:hypothetical protein
MKLKLSILAFLLVVFKLNAQTNFKPGQVFFMNGDSLSGEIDSRGNIFMGQICRFRSFGSEKTPENEKEYTPNDIAGYRFDNGKYFQSKEINGRKTFLEFLINGKISVYYNRDDNGDHYYIDKDSSGIIELPYEDYIKYANNVPYRHHSTIYLGLLNYYMQDAPGFQSKIAKLGNPGHRNLIKLAKEYHNIVCADEQCIVYEKHVPFIKISFEITAGLSVINTENFEGFKNVYDKKISDKIYLQYGLITHLWMPRENENLYFRSGIQFTNLEANRTKDSLLYIDNNMKAHFITVIGEKAQLFNYKIPLQLEYIFSTGTFRPKVAWGLNLYFPFEFDHSLTCGFNIRLNKFLFLNLNYDYEYLGIIIPKYSLAHSLFCGLQINL